MQMLDYDLVVLALLLVNLILGFGISYYIARRRYNEYEEKIASLEETISKSTRDLEKTKTAYNDLTTNTKNTILELEKGIEERQSSIEKYQTELKKAVDIIGTLKSNIEEKGNEIDSLKNKVNSLEEANKASTTRAIEAEGQVHEITTLSQAYEQEISELRSRILSMQDNLSHLSGIGPKVSSILQAAGVDTFAKLASTNLNKINEILTAANPNLLRLTDPSTWTEQAKLAAEGKWDELKSLQDEIKNKR